MVARVQEDREEQVAVFKTSDPKAFAEAIARLERVGGQAPFPSEKAPVPFIAAQPLWPGGGGRSA